MPTDTLYGLAVDPRNPVSVEALFAAKGRPPDSAVPLVAANLEQVEQQIGPLSAISRRLARVFWPGPLALIVDAPAAIVPAVHAGRGTVAVRVPAHAVPCDLAAAVGHPITATSANRSGRTAPATPETIVHELGDAVALVLDAGPAPGGAPSTIVDARGAAPVLVRAGAVPWERVLAVLAQL